MYLKCLYVDLVPAPRNTRKGTATTDKSSLILFLYHVNTFNNALLLLVQK